MSDLEDRVRELERLVVDLGQRVLDQAEEIKGLRQDMNREMTESALATLPGRH